MSPEKATIIVIACCHLHNFSRKKKCRTYHYRGYDIEDIVTCKMTNEDWRNDQLMIILQSNAPQNFPSTSKEIRDKFCENFNGPGPSVPWQNSTFIDK